MPLRFSPSPLVTLLLGLGLSLLLVGCGDNIGCVFTTGCTSSSGAGGIGGSGMPATAPGNGLFISNLPPEVQAIFPRGARVKRSAPIVVVFSESMNIDSLASAFELIPIVGNLEQPAVPIAQSILLGDGRVLVMLPAVPLTPGAYALRVSNEAMASLASDLTGQTLGASSGSNLGELFTVSNSAAVEPMLVTSWPQQGDMGISDTTEVVAIFDSLVSPLSVTTNSFQVEIGALAPGLNPAPRVLSFIARGSTVTDSRVFTWRSENAIGPAVLTAGANFELTLSPASAPIQSFDMLESMPETRVTGRIAPFATPAGAGLLSAPGDGIGLRNLTSGHAEEFLLQAGLSGALAGDFVDVFFFGNNTAVGPARQMVALRREKRLVGTGPHTSVSFSLSEVDLLQSNNPADPRFADGPIAIAMRLRRGGLSTPLHVLDSDPAQSGVQDVILDVTAPTIVSFDYASVFSGGEPLSEVRDAVISGRASEALRSVEVSITQGMTISTNGTQPDVVGAALDGTFIAAPVVLPGAGILAGGTASFTSIAYDRVFNASPATTGSLTQVGAVAAGPFVNSQAVSVQVFDAQTLGPLANTRVLLHSDVGGGSYPLHMEALTDANGNVTLTPLDTPLGRLVTVERAGYDLVTFHGITGNSLSIPMTRSGVISTSNVSGTIISSVASVAAILPSQSLRLDDSRRPAGAPSSFATNACIDNGGMLSCPPWGPFTITPGRRGAASLLSGNFALSPSTFSPNTLLRSFCVNLPTGFSPAVFGSFLQFDIPFLLELADASEQPLELAALEFRADGTSGINLGALDVDAGTTGDPRVSVETIIPGLPGTLAVGIGLAFDDGLPMHRWNVRSAVPGAVTPGGFFGRSGALDTDFFIRCELRDTLGNISGARSRLSNLATQAPLAGTLIAGNVPQLLSPLGTTGGESFDITFAETILASSTENGLYAAQLVDGQGKRWTIWTPDGTTDGVRTMHVPDLSASVATPLANGTLVLQLSSFSWEDLDFNAGFMWTSLEREHDQFAFSAPVVLVQP